MGIIRSEAAVLGKPFFYREFTSTAEEIKRLTPVLT